MSLTRLTIPDESVRDGDCCYTIHLSRVLPIPSLDLTPVPDCPTMALPSFSRSYSASVHPSSILIVFHWGHQQRPLIRSLRVTVSYYLQQPGNGVLRAARSSPAAHRRAMPCPHCSAPPSRNAFNFSSPQYGNLQLILGMSMLLRP